MKHKPYEKPAIILEKKLEALAADCGSGVNNPYLGTDTCKGLAGCTVPYS